MTPIAWSLAGAVLGAIFGSFLATLILRWPIGQSVLSGRSSCDCCGRSLGPLELVPLLSATLQKGRCRSCGSRINPLHGWVEAGCALIAGVAFLLMPGWEGPGWAIFGWLLLTLALLDVRHFWLPNALTLPLAFLGLTLARWITDVSLADRIIGAVSGYGVLLAISLGYRRLRGREGLGLGDAKLLGALGAWFGWQTLPFLLLVASMTALLAVGLSAMRSGDVHAHTRVPLGTFLCIAALPAWALSRRMLGM